MKKLTLIIAILFLEQANAKTIIVDQAGTGDAVSIMGGIAQSTGGDTVLVRPGTYIEEVSFPSHSLYLIGSGSDVTKIYYVSTAVKYNGQSGEISRFSIESTTNSAIIANISGGTLTIKQCVLSNSGTNGSGYVAELDNVRVLFFNNVIDGARYGIKPGSGSEIINNVFHNVNRGVNNNSNTTLTVQNNIFASCTYPIYEQAGLILSVYNNYYNNSNTFSNGTKGLGDIEDDPKFDDISKSYLLASDSPTRDAGNPYAVYNDGDGSRNDMGIYGGPNSWGDGPVITDLTITPTTINQGGTITIEATAKKN